MFGPFLLSSLKSSAKSIIFSFFVLSIRSDLTGSLAYWGRVFANGPRGQSSVPGSHTKDLKKKMVLDTSLLNT